MPTAVTVKWNKQSFEIDADTTQPPAVFKFQLYSLTGVPPERQRIMIKGGTLKDDTDWAKVALKEGQKLMMMGTADKIPEAPKEELVFMEDLPEDEQDHSGLGKYGAGLQNLGNTCYMNSTMQCLFRIPELRNSLQSLQLSQAGSQPTTLGPKRLAAAARDLFANMERSAEAVVPMQFLLQLRQQYPQFAQQTNAGVYMQQDAEECWTNILYSLKEAFQAPQGGSAPEAVSDPVVQRLLGVDLHTELKCEESGEVIAEDSSAFSLRCNITSEVNHLTEGLKLGLKDDRQKNSEALGMLADFKGSSVITKLPPYINVQLVRFFYKRDVQQKSKILRKVTFPLVLDCYELCSEAYKKQLEGPREAYKEVEDRKAGLLKKKKDAEKKEADEKDSAKDAGKKRPLTENASKSSAKAKDEATGSDVEMKEAADASSSGVDISSHVGKETGRYELVAVLTHKGRSADSGHYVSWAKQEDKTWVQFDDDQMIPRKEEEIIELSGGGDWHMAYLLLYKAITVSAE